jgi:putative SOS response-associated peptidase YedK
VSGLTPVIPRHNAYPIRMCGRFYLIASASQLRRTFRVDDAPDLKPRYNIAPTRMSPIVIGAGDSRCFRMARWGLVPPWSRDLSVGAGMFNAPAEAIDEKPVFRTAFHAQRCLVPASGFYEWENGTRQPYRIALRNRALLGLAGLWEKWVPESGEPVHTFTIVTTRANRLVSEVHERMPVIIAPADYQRWLSGPEQSARRLLVPFTGGMTITAVSDRVNDIKVDDVGLIAPI